MPVTIESLLEENLGKVQELLEASEAAHQNVTAIDALGDRIEQQFESSSESGKAALENLQTTIASLANTFEQFQQQSDAKLDEVTSQVSAAEERAMASANQISQAVTEVKGRITTADTELEAKLTSTEAELQELSEGADEYQQLVESTLEKTGQVAEEFQTKVESAVTALEQKKSAVESEYDALSSDAQQELEAAVQAMEKGVEETQQKLTASLESTQNTSQTSATAMRQKLAEGGLQTLIQQFDEVSSALELVTDTSDKLGLDFGESLGGVIESIEEVVALVEKIKPVLKLADEIL